MKNQLLLFCFITCTCTLWAQDEQWYLKNENWNQVNILQVAHPDRDFDPRSKNDVLIIFTDNSFYNSRENIAIDAGDPIKIDHADSSPFKGVQNGHNYRLESAKQIKYLYFSNIYEGDDPDAIYNNSLSHSITYPPISVPPSGALDPAYFNHDIVPNKDVTLSLNLGELLPAENDVRTCEITLCYNQIGTWTNNEIKNVQGREFLELNNVFGSSPILGGNITSQTANEDGSCITIQTENPDYLHVNFRGTEEIQEYIWDDNFAHFSLSSNCGIQASFLENVRLSHDPNFTKVDSVCTDSNGKNAAYFHLQFFNDGSDLVTQIMAKANLPSMIDHSSICIKDWKAGNMDASSGEKLDMAIAGNSIKFNWPDGANLSCYGANVDGTYNGNHYGSTIGYVKFCASIKDKVVLPTGPNQNLDWNELDLEPLLDETSFDGTLYPIDQFIWPKIRIKDLDQDVDIRDCNCICKNDPGKIGLNQRTERDKAFLENAKTSETQGVNTMVSDKLKYGLVAILILGLLIFLFRRKS